MYVSCIIQNKTHIEEQSISRIFCVCDTHWTANKLVAKGITVKLTVCNNHAFTPVQFTLHARILFDLKLMRYQLKVARTDGY